jgi:hypothetical protein
MDDRHSKKAGKADLDSPSQEEKEAMTATLEKARLKDVRVAQPVPLATQPSHTQPPGGLGTAAPNPSAIPAGTATQGYHGDHYGGYVTTAFNSSAVSDREVDSRNEYHYQQGLYSSRAATSTSQGYPAQFSAPFYQADAYGRDHRAYAASSAREIPHPAMDRIEKLMEGIARATTASSNAIQQFVGQGEFSRFFVDFICLFHGAS